MLISPFHTFDMRAFSFTPNWYGPITAGLIGLWPFSAGAGLVASNIARGDQATLTGSNPWGAGGLISKAATDGMNWQSVAPIYKPTQNVTLLWYGYTLGTSGGSPDNPRVFALDTANNNSGLFVAYGFYKTGLTLVPAWNDSSALRSGTALTMRSGPTCAAISLDGITVRAFMDGVQAFSTTTNVGTIGYTSTATLYVGNRGAGGGFANVVTFLGAIWNRTLDLDEMAAVTANPWSLLSSSFFPMNQTLATTIPPSAGTFRRTLSALGTRTGTRQGQ